MHAVLCAYGTMGNVLPFIGWGRALRARGHRVTILGSTNVGPIAEREGIEFVPVQEPAEDSPSQRRSGARSRLQFLRRQYQTVLRGYHPALTPLVRQRDVVVAAPFWIMGARLACEEHGAPLATIYLQAVMLADDTERRPLRRALRSLVVWLANRVVSRKLNAYRKELGLSRVRRPLDWWNSPDAVLAFFPEWYSPRQAGWPAQLQHVGFPMFDVWDSAWRTEELERFLQAGDPPLVFSQSSNARIERESIGVSIEAARRLNRRAIFLTTRPEQLPDPLPSHVGYFGIVPLSVILPRAAAFIHHGGIGSLSQGIAAGVPQLTVPKILDQFDNCRRLLRLGLSRQLEARHYRTDRVVDELKVLLESPEIAGRCRDYSARMPTGDPFAAACDALERVLQNRTARGNGRG